MRTLYGDSVLLFNLLRDVDFVAYNFVFLLHQVAYIDLVG